MAVVVTLITGSGVGLNVSNVHTCTHIHTCVHIPILSSHFHTVCSSTGNGYIINLRTELRTQHFFSTHIIIQNPALILTMTVNFSMLNIRLILLLITFRI